MKKQCNRCKNLDIILDSKYNLIPVCSLAKSREAAIRAYCYNNSRFHKEKCASFIPRTPDVMDVEDEVKGIASRKHPRTLGSGL